MSRTFLPYYISRAILSAIFSWLVFGLSWIAFLFSIIIFGLFLLYLHSGWFKVDPKNPLLPLRRDDHGQSVQRKAILIAIVVGFLTYLSLSQLTSALGLGLSSGSIALAVATIAYFASQFVLFIKA